MKINKIRKEYQDFTLDINELNLSHKVTVVIGNIGAGKTTLLKGISNLNGSEVVREKEYTIFYKQDLETLPKMFVSTYLDFMKAFVPEFNIEKATHLIGGFSINLYDRLQDLSSGQKDIISTILALSVDREYIVLDEPFTRVDPFNRKKLTNLIIDEYEHKKFIIASHEVEHLERLLDYVVLLKEGKVINESLIETIEQSGGIKEWYKMSYMNGEDNE